MVKKNKLSIKVAKLGIEVRDYFFFSLLLNESVKTRNQTN